MPWAERSLSVSCVPLSHSCSNSRTADSIWLKEKTALFSKEKIIIFNFFLPWSVESKSRQQNQIEEIL